MGRKIREGGAIISKIHRLSSRIFHRMMKEYGLDALNPAQTKIVYSLWENGSMPISALAGKTGLTKSTLTSMIVRLIKKNIIEKNYLPEDRRISLISLKDGGKNILSSYDELSARMNGLFYSGFSEKEIDSFEEKLAQIYENLGYYEKNKGASPSGTAPL